MSKYLNPDLSGLESYTPGEQPRDMKYIKLNTNESPYPPSPQVVAAVNSRETELLRLYPDPDAAALKDALAARYGVNGNNIFLSNGSDDILNFAFLAFAGGGRGRKAWFPDISYGFYQVFADLYGIPAVKVPLKDDFSIDPSDYVFGNSPKKTENRDDGGLICIANPNAPTGLTLSLSQIESILKANPGKVVLIDEAYVDFGAESAVPLTGRYDNLLVVQTFSKSRSMAGARLGFAIAASSLIDDLEKIKFSTNPYNINRLTMAAGIAALASDDYFMANCRTIAETREYTKEALEKLGFSVLPSAANFIFAKSDRIEGGRLYTRLKEKGVLIRHFEKERIRDFNRITIGTREEMDAMLEKIKEILEEDENESRRS